MATLFGFGELAAKLRALGELANAGETAAKAAAIPIQNAWRKRAPVETGSYRRSIHIYPEVQHEGTSVTVLVGTNITDPPYPVYLEYGTSKMAARPSARPAFDEAWPEARKEAAAIFQKKIQGLVR